MATSNPANTHRKLFLLHAFLCSIGFVGIFYFVSSTIATYFTGRVVIEFNEGVRDFYFPQKPVELFAYLATITGLLAYYLFIYHLASRQLRFPFLEAIASSSRKVALYVVVLVILIAALACIPGPLYRHLEKNFGRSVSLLWSAGLALLIWFPVFCGPLLSDLDRLRSRLDRIFIKSRPAFLLLAVLATIQMIVMYAPFVFGKLRMMNEYLDIPEQTRLSTGLIDNDKFINTCTFIGLRKYNPASGTVSADDTLACKVPWSKTLSDFINDRQNGAGLKYSYDPQIASLRLNGNMLEDECKELKRIVGPKHADSIDEMFNTSQARLRQIRSYDYTPQDEEFFLKNKLELVWQIQNRWVIHHASFILIPAMEYDLGKPLNRIYAQYGLPNSIIAAKLMKMLGGISYHNYYKVWYSVYLVYYAIFLWLIFILFRKSLPYITISWLLTAACLGFIGYQFIFLGPGLSPIRHFFDAFVILFLYLYLKNIKAYALALAGFFAVLGIANNPQLGLICMAAFTIAMIVILYRQGTQRRISHVLILAISLALGAAVFLASGHGYDPVTSYYKAGLLGFDVPNLGMFVIFLSFSLGYLVFLRSADTWGRDHYMALFLLFLSQGFLIYYVWGGTPAQFFNLGPIYVITAVKLIQLLPKTGSSLRRNESVMVLAFSALAVMFFFVSVLVFNASKREYTKVFDDHQTYQWNLDTASFESTMPPELFTQSVNLIKKYSPDKNAIHIVSKYDDFLTFLSRKYSAMPFFNLQWLMLTKKETNMAIQELINSKPEYLFVDTDIERCKNTELVYPSQFLMPHIPNESVKRVLRLRELSSVFHAVKDQYEPLERGSLITVYKRKPLSGAQ